MQYSFILSQIFVIIAVLLQGVSYLNKDKKKIMFLCTFYAIFYGLQYLLLGAMTGLAMNMVNIIRNIWFYYNAKGKRKNKPYMLLIILMLVATTGMLTYANIYSLIPIAAASIITYSLWQSKTGVFRLLSLPISILWITYDIYCHSIFGVIAETVLLGFELLGIYKYDVKKKKRLMEENSLC